MFFIVTFFFAFYIGFHDDTQHQIKQEKRAEEYNNDAIGSRYKRCTMLTLHIIGDYCPAVKRYCLKNSYKRLSNMIKGAYSKLNVGIMLYLVIL